MTIVYNRFWKEIVGDFKIEKRKAQGKTAYVVSRDRQPDGFWTFVNSYRTKSQARAYVRAQQPPPPPPLTDAEKQTIKEHKHRIRLEARRNRAFNKRKEIEARQAEAEKIEADKREAMGLPRMALVGVVGAHAYLAVMKEKYGQNWKPSTPAVFDNKLKVG